MTDSKELADAIRKIATSIDDMRNMGIYMGIGMAIDTLGDIAVALKIIAKQLEHLENCREQRTS